MKYDKNYDYLDYINESAPSFHAPHCKWCNELLTVSNGLWDDDGNLVVECYCCGYVNEIKKSRRF